MDSQHSSFQFSQRALQLTSSAIREILKVTTPPEVISFAGGLPSPEGTPVEQWQQAFDRVLATQGRAAVQYEPTDGCRPLRGGVAAHVSRPRAEVAGEDAAVGARPQQPR